MNAVFEIGEVARRTGLTHRALRFYEARGLIRPLRSEGGRRVYGAGELARLNAIVTLKRAGFSIAEIGRMLSDTEVDLGCLIAAQIDAIDVQVKQAASIRALLQAALSRFDRGEPVDVAMLCSLIRTGATMMEPEHWKAVTDRYFTPAEKREWAERMAEVPDGFDQEAYGARWKALSARIEAALPLEPMSPPAQRFVDEWFALLKPFSSVATPAMWNGASRLYGDMDAWQGKADPGFSKAVWDFITSATRARLDAGGTVDGPAWMTDGRPA
jgi:DNA-binding transcriptional MerR regulator